MNPATALRIHRLLMRLAFSACNMFAWIFVFELFYVIGGDVAGAMVHTVLLYALSQIVATLLTPYTARGLRHGMLREMVLGVVLAAWAFIDFGLVLQGHFADYYTFVIAGFAIALGGYRAFYWVPYEVERHETQSLPSIFSFEILIALMPAFMGCLLVSYGFREFWVLTVSGCVMIAALIPLFWMRDSYEGFSWGYRETFGRLLDRAHRRLVGGAVSDGIQGAALLLIWPLAIFLIIGGSYELLGLLLTLTLLILLIVRDGMDGIIRRLRVLRSLPVRIAIVSSAWVGRILVFNPVSIIFSDAYLHAGNPKISTDHGTFEQTSDAGHFIDEYTVLREIGLLIGRILLCIAFVLTANAFSLYVAFGTAFVIAGIAAGLSVIAGSGARSSI